MLALRRFASLQRTGRVPASLYPVARRIRRWTLIIETLTALSNDPAHRAVAISLFGDAAVADAQDGASDFLQARVRRLVAEARRLAGGGYLDLIRAR